MRLFLILLTIISFGASGSVSNVVVDGNIASTAIETMNGKSVPLGRNKVLLDADKDNLLVNGSFEHQVATTGWTFTGTAYASEGMGFEGKKAIILNGDGDVYQMLTDTDKFHGMQVVFRGYIRNRGDTNDAKVCLTDGTTKYKCTVIAPVNVDMFAPADEGYVEYVLKDTIIKGKSIGIVVSSTYYAGLGLDAFSAKLDKNEAFVANIEGDYQQVVLSGTSITPTTNLDSLAKSLVRGNSQLFTLSSSGVTLLRNADVSVTISSSNESSAVIGATVFVNGTVLAIDNSQRTGTSRSGSTVRLFLKKGDIVTVDTHANSSSAILAVSATARSQVINYPDETFSTDINPVYWKATPCGEDEIGCFNTYPYPASSNTPGTICTTRPTQTDEDMRVNGIRAYTRIYTSASSCSSPARVEVIIGKNFATPFVRIFKDTTRLIAGTLMSEVNSDYQKGAWVNVYNPFTGRLTVDLGRTQSTATNNHNIVFEDLSEQNNGYLVISATKNGGALVNKSPRTLVKVVEDGDNWAHIYSDGWVEQRVVSASFSTPASAGSATISTDLLIPQKDTSYASTPSLQGASACATATDKYNTSTVTSVSTGIRGHCSSSASGVTASIIVKGYGAASYLLNNYGIKVGY